MNKNTRKKTSLKRLKNKFNAKTREEVSTGKLETVANTKPLFLSTILLNVMSDSGRAHLLVQTLRMTTIKVLEKKLSEYSYYQVAATNNNKFIQNRFGISLSSRMLGILCPTRIYARPLHSPTTRIEDETKFHYIGNFLENTSAFVSTKPPVALDLSGPSDGKSFYAHPASHVPIPRKTTGLSLVNILLYYLKELFKQEILKLLPGEFKDISITPEGNGVYTFHAIK